ncbi:MAG: YggS family pyridoxal phosphate-dependent enzyme [Clostridia bacterium]|nr:YggS family pyridoxal phosphate-dependent enzyme [Clostridia bacterium]
MRKAEITENVQKIKEELAKGNGFGEKVLLCAATKMQTAEDINHAIEAGVDAVAENKPQEFRDKRTLLLPCPRHFIGHLQTNKIKYLLGEIELYHSCDREDLAQALAKSSVAKGLTSNVLIQINIGQEESKGGYDYETAKEVFARLSTTEGLCVKGFMAMLPEAGEESYHRDLVRKMRRLFEWAKTQSAEVEYLSMGMSGDYKLCVEEGANIVRIGSTIFGKRDYGRG